MPYHRKVDAAAFAFAVALSRFVFRSHVPYDLDCVNFVLGMARFDPRTHQPHPPGYFLYICCGRLLGYVVHNPNLSFVLLSIAASCGTVVFIYLLALRWFDRLAARFAGLLFVLSPLAWFHGAVALTYSVEAFFSALIGYLCWLLFRGRYRWIPASSLALGISTGVRPSSLLFLGPLFLFALYRAPIRYRVVGLLLVVLTIAGWFVPMVLASGGPHAYFYAFDSLWRTVPSKTTIFNSSPLNSIARAATITFIYVLTFGTGSLAAIAASRHTPVRSLEFRFSAVWAIPALCFFTLIYLRFVNSGYLLLLVAPGSIWVGRWLAEWYRASRLPRGAKWSILTAGALVNIAVFLFSPLYCSYRSIRGLEAQLRRVDQALPKVATPGRTLIVAFDSHFLGFRHAGYALPQYQVIEYPEVALQDGVRVFAMRGLNTSLLQSLPVVASDRFIFFPLPPGPEYRKYLESVTARLPAGDVKVLHADGIDFLTGSIACLNRIFPQMAPTLPSRQCVSGVPVKAAGVYSRGHSAGDQTP
jgi:hypothetical protein